MYMIMGFGRNVGYFFAILMVMGGLLAFPIGLVIAIPGFIFIWMLKRSAATERIEKELKSINQIETDNQRLKLEQRRKTALEERDRTVYDA